MRKIAGLLLAVALVVPVTFLAAPVEAAGGTSCKSGIRGLETWKPPLIRSGSPNKTRPTITIGSAKVTGCKNGGVKSGTLSAKIRWLDPGNCDSLFKYREGEPFPRIRGTVSVTWNTKETSTANVTITRHKPYVQPVEGKVSKGKFKGSKFSVLLLIAPANGACTSRDMYKTKFSSLTSLSIK